MVTDMDFSGIEWAEFTRGGSHSVGAKLAFYANTTQARFSKRAVEKMDIQAGDKLLVGIPQGAHKPIIEFVMVLDHSGDDRSLTVSEEGAGRTLKVAASGLRRVLGIGKEKHDYFLDEVTEYEGKTAFVFCNSAPNGD